MSCTSYVSYKKCMAVNLPGLSMPYLPLPYNDTSTICPEKNLNQIFLFAWILI